jgi:hypothetical protein
MRSSKGLVVGLIAAALVGCTSSGTEPHFISLSPTADAKAGPVAAPGGPAEPKTKAGARAAAARFYSLFFGSQLADSWDLLAPVAKQQISRSIWIKVHDSCPSVARGKERVIKSVTLFGDTAIVTEGLPGPHSKRGRSEDVFTYYDGHWGYSPGNPSIYRHGSIAADIAAAKKAGLCTSKKAASL